MARDSKQIKITLPDNIHAVILAISGDSGEAVSEYCARAIVTKVEQDLMDKLPEKWQAFTANIEPKEE
jgi:hypothetical protein